MKSVAIRYFDEMKIDFPEIEEELNLWEENQCHLKMEVFAKYTNQQILDGNDKELIRCFYFQEKRMGWIDTKLKNAIYVSYCETLLFENEEKVMKEKIQLMPKKLKGLYQEYEKNYKELFNKLDP